MQITKLEESKVKEYRGCFINGLMDSKYINLYKNTLGYFKERIERVLASEIVYYESNNGNIDVATMQSLNNKVFVICYKRNSH